jgi:calcineurin-like phosphoesterase family protein
MNLGQKIDLDNNDRNRKIWFMSDLHYNHENILWINQPTRGDRFKDLEEMNQYILSELREKVGPNDILFDLGDLIWKEGPPEIKSFSEVLPVRSFRLLGNHDGKNLVAWGKTWMGVYDILDLIIKKDGEDIRLTLSHYPILDWNHRYRGSWDLHGHCHGGIDKLNNESDELRMDIGFDSEIASRIGSFLIPFEFVLEVMKEKTDGEKFREWAKDKFN